MFKWDGQAQCVSHHYPGSQVMLAVFWNVTVTVGCLQGAEDCDDTTVLNVSGEESDTECFVGVAEECSATSPGIQVEQSCDFIDMATELDTHAGCGSWDGGGGIGAGSVADRAGEEVGLGWGNFCSIAALNVSPETKSYQLSGTFTIACRQSMDELNHPSSKAQ